MKCPHCGAEIEVSPEKPFCSACRKRVVVEVEAKIEEPKTELPPETEGILEKAKSELTPSRIESWMGFLERRGLNSRNARRSSG